MQFRGLALLLSPRKLNSPQNNSIKLHAGPDTMDTTSIPLGVKSIPTNPTEQLFTGPNYNPNNLQQFCNTSQYRRSFKFPYMLPPDGPPTCTLVGAPITLPAPPAGRRPVSTLCPPWANAKVGELLRDHTLMELDGAPPPWGPSPTSNIGGSSGGWYTPLQNVPSSTTPFEYCM
mmetsp:Transcript_7443/g.16253  ORF Transcript_7443/g.16253 Transcript_7443/m.16253 type:complete len:174 (+) Transcript_7443:686-1207(+)